MKDLNSWNIVLVACDRFDKNFDKLFVRNKNPYRVKYLIGRFNFVQDIVKKWLIGRESPVHSEKSDDRIESITQAIFRNTFQQKAIYVFENCLHKWFHGLLLVLYKEAPVRFVVSAFRSPPRYTLRAR